MKTRLIKIGNSQGIRIPKVLLEQSGLGEEVELEVQDAQIVIRPAERPRPCCSGRAGRGAAPYIIGRPKVSGGSPARR